MSIIIAGHFQLQDEAVRAVDVLADAGYARDGISCFFVNPAGQHDVFPIGGDRDKSPGAQDTDKGAAAGTVAGAAAGVAAGIATAPVTGPLGAALGGLVGGHVGALVGSLSTTDDSHTGVARRRDAGMLVAVEVIDDEQLHRALVLLRGLNAQAIERSKGHIRHGNWEDFDPLVPPVLIDDKT